MIIELVPGRIVADSDHIVSAQINGAYPDKIVIVLMTTGHEFVIGSQNNPDFSADKLYGEIMAARQPAPDTDLPMTVAEIHLLAWAVDQAKDWAGGMPAKDDRDHHLTKIKDARAALTKLRKFTRKRTS